MYLGTGDFLQESQMAHLFQEGLLGVFPLFSAAASLAKDGSLAEDTCQAPAGRRHLWEEWWVLLNRCLDHLGLRRVPVMLPRKRELWSHLGFLLTVDGQSSEGG